MDRRQQKTQQAIFEAFSRLLARKPYHRITVQEIIDEANVGRATFYAHFETKDYLLKALCRELFDHIIDSARNSQSHCDVVGGQPPRSVFLHLLLHLQKNDHNILGLLTGQNNELFLRYFKGNLQDLAAAEFSGRHPDGLPEDFWVNHVTASFVETVNWWLRNGHRESPEILNSYFLATIEPLLPRPAD